MTTVRGMGQITLWAEQYHQGLIDLETLIAHLDAFEFQTPARFKDIPADLFEAEAQAEERTYDDEDTMDELLGARDRGLLTRADLEAIMEVLLVDG